MNNGDPSLAPDRRRRVPIVSPEEGSSLLHSLHVLRRRGWILAVAVGALTGLAVVAAVSRPPRYRSEATIEVGPDRPLVSPDSIGDPHEGSSLLWENHFRTQETLLRRPGLLARVLEALPPEEVAAYRAAPDPVRRLSEDVDIDSVPSTFLIRITLDHTAPERGPRIVNKIVELFIEDANRRLRELKTGALEILDTEALPVMRQKVEESEQKLREFHQTQGFGDLEEQYAGLQEAKRRTGARLSDVRLDRIAIRNGASTGRAGDAAADPDRSPARDTLVTRSTELEVELARQSALLKEGHPTVMALKRQIEAVRELMAESERERTRLRERDLAAVDLEERALMEEEERLDRAMSESQGRLAKYRDLQREVGAARELYTSYLKKQGEVKATSGAGLTSVRVVDLARDARLHSQGPGLFISLGIILGLVLGIVGILVAEQVDDRITSPRHAESTLGLDVLASVPVMKSRVGDGPLIPADDPSSASLEPFRRLRTEIEMRLQDAPGPKIVAVLSSDRGEGRSTVAIHLARVLGRGGRRVLLVDADLRRPRLWDLLVGGETQSAGGVRESRLPGVHVVEAPRSVEGPSEAPGTARFRTLWTAARAEFDYVVVDTSPLQAASEAPVVARAADASLFVVEEGRTGSRLALAVRRRLETLQVRILGVVVNRSRLRLTSGPDVPRPGPGPVRPDAARTAATSAR